MEPLFDKSLDELRDAFVRARFTEPAMFRRPDIEEWLRGQEESQHPDRLVPGFGRFGGFVERHAPHPLTVEHLTQYATPIRRAGNWQRWVSNASPEILKIILALVNGGAKLYRSNDGGPIFVVDDTAFVVRCDQIRTLDAPAFLDVVFSEWDYGGRKAGTAREFICGAMARAIAEVRQAAERDFDEAVAVSPDGTKIVKADWIVVGRSEGRRNRATIYDVEAFRAAKALLPRRHERFNYRTAGERGKVHADNVVDFVKAISARNHVFGGEGMSLLHDTPHGNIVFVDEALCPSTLPEGGREIRV